MLGIVLLSLHLLGVGTLVGMVVLTLFLFGPKQFERVGQETLLIIRRIGMYGAALAILTGLIMFARYFEHLIRNPLFITKLALVLADGIIAERIIKHRLEQLQADDQEGQRQKLVGWAWLSLAVVVAIVSISVYRAKIG